MLSERDPVPNQHNPGCAPMSCKATCHKWGKPQPAKNCFTQLELCCCEEYKSAALILKYSKVKAKFNSCHTTVSMFSEFLPVPSHYCSYWTQVGQPSIGSDTALGQEMKALPTFKVFTSCNKNGPNFTSASQHHCRP